MMQKCKRYRCKKEVLRTVRRQSRGAGPWGRVVRTRTLSRVWNGLSGKTLT